MLCNTMQVESSSFNIKDFHSSEKICKVEINAMKTTNYTYKEPNEINV